jgi:hypothetical protein
VNESFRRLEVGIDVPIRLEKNVGISIIHRFWDSFEPSTRSLGRKAAHPAEIYQFLFMLLIGKREAPKSCTVHNIATSCLSTNYNYCEASVRLLITMKSCTTALLAAASLAYVSAQLTANLEVSSFFILLRR